MDKSFSGHSFTYQESISVSSAEIKAATAYEVTGTPVDCVSLALSGALFAWSKPLMGAQVIVGVNKGPSCGHDMVSSSAVAGARQPLISGVPSLSVSLNWKKKSESQESHFKDAVSVCLPLIKAAIRDAEKEAFPKSSSLHITIPTLPTENKRIGYPQANQQIITVAGLQHKTRKRIHEQRTHELQLRCNYNSGDVSWYGLGLQHIFKVDASDEDNQQDYSGGKKGSFHQMLADGVFACTQVRALKWDGL